MFTLDCDDLTYTPLRYNVVDFAELQDAELNKEIQKDAVILYETT